ncbi:MAG TPA: hypothetical protein VII75_01065 [Thermoanaerobaculia bacterium]
MDALAADGGTSQSQVGQVEQFIHPYATAKDHRARHHQPRHHMPRWVIFAGPDPE